MSSAKWRTLCPGFNVLKSISDKPQKQYHKNLPQQECQATSACIMGYTLHQGSKHSMDK